MRLAEDRFYNTYPCVIISGKGQPDVATRLFKMLAVNEQTAASVKRDHASYAKLSLLTQQAQMDQITAQLAQRYSQRLAASTSSACASPRRPPTRSTPPPSSSTSGGWSRRRARRRRPTTRRARSSATSAT